LPHDAWPVGPAGPQKAVGAGGVKIPVDAPRVVVVVGGADVGRRLRRGHGSHCAQQDRRQRHTSGHRRRGCVCDGQWLVSSDREAVITGVDGNMLFQGASII
jgi:hypothetical protein